MAISSVQSSMLQVTAALKQPGQGDAKADYGLQDRATSDERLSAAQSLQQQVIQNHGFEAKQAVKEALTNNSKIINIPVQQRGSLLDTVA